MQKKGMFITIAASLTAVLTLAGCGQSQGGSGKGVNTSDLQNENWSQIVSQAKGQTVNIYMWGGSQNENQYIDNWVAPRLDIPYNAKHKAAAMVAINFMESPEAQLAMFNPKIIGTPVVMDLQKLSPSDRKQFEDMNRGIATLPQNVLDAHRVPEIPSDYVPFLEEEWTSNVAKK